MNETYRYGGKPPEHEKPVITCMLLNGAIRYEINKWSLATERWAIERKGIIIAWKDFEPFDEGAE
jgi:hypothetical protein